MQTQAIGVFPAHSGPVLAVVWPKEDMIVTGSTDESLRSWKLDLVHETLGKEKEIILQEKLLTKDTVATAHALGVQSIAFDQKGARKLGETYRMLQLLYPSLSSFSLHLF